MGGSGVGLGPGGGSRGASLGGRGMRATSSPLPLFTKPRRLPCLTSSRPASVRRTLSPRSSIQPRSTATAIASFVRSFSLAGNTHQRGSPSVA